jgi:arsenical pump membrane protein
MILSGGNLATWLIVAIAIVGVIARPFRWPEAIWAVSGAALLLVFGLLPWTAAVTAVGRGLDVYLFLIGMMLLSELARREGVFDVVAAVAVNAARGSTTRLFALVYAVGVVVTVFLSNDATAVVLTPAVFAVARRARANPLPQLLVCAFVANAASFVLPISNPANLVLYASHTPPLMDWLARFALPSAAAILSTYAGLRWMERKRLVGECRQNIRRPTLTPGGWTALGGVGVTAVGLVVVSCLNLQLGLPTFIFGAATTAVVLIRGRGSPAPVLKGVAWSVLPLVAGLFVLVAGLTHTGLVAVLAGMLHAAAQASTSGAAVKAGGFVALASNLTNNLPAGLVASAAVAQTHPPAKVIDALLIGVDLGPNLSITGSLATILWLGAIRREGYNVGFWRFLRVGVVVAPPALILAVGARLLLA